MADQLMQTKTHTNPDGTTVQVPTTAVIESGARPVGPVLMCGPQGSRNAMLTACWHVGVDGEGGFVVYF